VLTVLLGVLPLRLRGAVNPAHRRARSASSDEPDIIGVGLGARLRALAPRRKENGSGHRCQAEADPALAEAGDHRTPAGFEGFDALLKCVILELESANTLYLKRLDLSKLQGLVLLTTRCRVPVVTHPSREYFFDFLRYKSSLRSRVVLVFAWIFPLERDSPELEKT
jgi:hypothetical protein